MANMAAVVLYRPTLWSLEMCNKENHIKGINFRTFKSIYQFDRETGSYRFQPLCFALIKSHF